MKALRKQRLCSFLWGWGKWENRPCSIQKRPGISLPDRFSLFQGGTYGAPLQIPGRFILARAVQHIPVTGKKEQPTPSLLSIHGFHRTAPAVWEKDKRDSLRCPSCQSMAFTRPRQRSEKKTKGTAYAVPPCQSMAFTRPRQRSEKKTKGTACAVPLSIYGFHPTAPAVWEKDKRDRLRCPSCLWGNHKI